MKFAYPMGVAIAAAIASPATAATTFDLENTPQGEARVVRVKDGGLGLTITGDTPGSSVIVTQTGLALIRTGAIARDREYNWAPMRFTFDLAVDSVTFNYGDGGGEPDGPVYVSAYSDAGNLLGTVVGGYDEGERLGRTIVAAFAGTRYFVVSSGVGNAANGLFWDISSVTIGTAGGVPEPATWALMILGMGVVGGAMRRRRSGMAIAAA